MGGWARGGGGGGLAGSLQGRGTVCQTFPAVRDGEWSVVHWQGSSSSCCWAAQTSPTAVTQATVMSINCSTNSNGGSSNSSNSIRMSSGVIKSLPDQTKDNKCGSFSALQASLVHVCLTTAPIHLWMGIVSAAERAQSSCATDMSHIQAAVGQQ